MQCRETALMYACKLQDEEFVEELIKHVKDVNICDSDGKTVSCTVQYKIVKYQNSSLVNH